MKLLTNGKRDFIASAFLTTASTPVTDACLAAPFFSRSEEVQSLLDQGAAIRLIVRLCGATQPDALRKILGKERLTIRFFTSMRFHAKVYLFDDTAVVGSGNLTSGGLQANREAALMFRRDESETFEELETFFEELWEAAESLSPEILAEFSLLRPSLPRDDDDKAISDLLGDIAPANIDVGSRRLTPERGFLQALRRHYEERLSPAFQEVVLAFEQFGKRRPECVELPIRVEVSRFLSWVRRTRTTGDSWRLAPELGATARKALLEPLFGDWIETKSPDLAADQLARYNRVVATLGTPASILAASEDELFEALIVSDAFYELLRFNLGGLPSLKRHFFESNGLDRIKRSLSHLLHGQPADHLKRMHDVIYGRDHKLVSFGRSCVFDLFGWVNAGIRPIINNRTVYALRYLGHSVSI